MCLPFDDEDPNRPLDNEFHEEFEDECDDDDDDYPIDEDGCDNFPGEEMDGDFDSGMASAGFGTDEDYGYYGSDEWD